MNWYPVLFLIGTIKLIVGASTEETSAPPITAVDQIHTSQIAATNLGRFPYQNGEVIIFQNQLKQADFFFTPFPQVEPNLTECSDNEFGGRTELLLFVSLFTTDLLESVKRRIKNQNAPCQTENCDISLLPIQSVRLIHKGFQTIESTTKYILNSEWQSNTPILQTVQFIIYTSNMSTCESLRNAITSRCRLSDFEVQYSAPGQQTIVRTVEVTTGHVANTSMAKQIQSQLYSKKQELFALTEADYKKFLNETMDRITMNLRAEEGFDSIYDSVEMGQLLESELRYMQVQLTEVKDQVWQSLYWTPDLTRPDRLSEVWNTLMKQDGTDSDTFRYDYSQADEAVKKNLTPHDRQKFDNFAQYLAVQAELVTNTSGAENHVGYQPSGSFFYTPSGSEEIDTDGDVHNQNTDEEDNLNDDLIHYKMDMGQFQGTNDEKSTGVAIILERKYAERLVRHFSEHVEIQYNIIKPKSMKIILVKVYLLKSNIKLFSNVVHVKTRMHLNVLPLRCPYEYRNHSLQNNRVTEKCDHLLNIVANLTHTVDAKYDHLLSIINNLTNIVMKIERSTNASMNTIMATNLSMQTATAKWAPNGVTVAGGHRDGTETNQLYWPRGLCVDAEDTVIVADYWNHRIVEWKRDATSGTVLAGGNGQGNRTDQLNYPVAVIFDKETDSLIICDWQNRRVTQWSRRSGTLSGVTIIDDIYCFGLAMDDKGSLYVTDSVKREVRRYRRGETNGTVVAGGNGKGEGLHQLNEPYYVFVDGEYAVYVSDNFNHRVMKWAKDAKEGTVVAGGQDCGANLTQLCFPCGVLVDAAGNVYVADYLNNRIMRWSRGATQGTVVVGGNGDGEGANQFSRPYGLSFDRHGHLYVVDYLNHRVQQFLIEKN